MTDTPAPSAPATDEPALPAAPPARLFLTSMSSAGQLENIVEMIEPLIPHLDGIIWVLHDTPADDPGAVYLEQHKGAGRVIHRAWPTGRHFHSMNETLFTGLIEEGSLVIWADALERPMAEFVKHVKTDVNALMHESEVDLVAYYGKAFLFRYAEHLAYVGSPHWSLTGCAKAIEWSKVEPDEKLVRWNVRPLKRTDPLQWVSHMARYWVAYPAGSNSALLGLDHFPGGQTQETFMRRELTRLAFRRLMRDRGFPLTLDGLKALFAQPLDDLLRQHLRAEKTLSDFYHWLHGRGAQLKHSHVPTDALPIE